MCAVCQLKHSQLKNIVLFVFVRGSVSRVQGLCAGFRVQGSGTTEGGSVFAFVCVCVCLFVCVCVCLRVFVFVCDQSRVAARRRSKPLPMSSSSLLVSSLELSDTKVYEP